MSSIILESSIGPSDETLSVTFLIDGFDALLSVEKLVKMLMLQTKSIKRLKLQQELNDFSSIHHPRK